MASFERATCVYAGALTGSINQHIALTLQAILMCINKAVIVLAAWLPLQHMDLSASPEQRAFHDSATRSARRELAKSALACAGTD